MVEKNFTKIPNKILRNQFEPKLSSYEYSLLMYLMSHKNDYVLSDVQIMDELGYARKTIRRYKNKLIERGIISVKYIKNRGYLYKFHIGPVGTTSPADEDHVLSQMRTTSPAKDGEHVPNGSVVPSQMGSMSPADEEHVPTENTNYKTKEKTTSVEFLKEKIREKIDNFFNNMIDERVDGIIESIDPSFYAFKSYTPKDKEIKDFIEKGNVESLDSFDEYLYNGIITESFSYNGGFIKPRLALFLSNSYRMSELIDFHFNKKQEEVVLSEAKEHPLKKKRDEFYGNAPTFEEFISQQEVEKESNEEYDELPEEESSFLQALHSYSESDFDSENELDSYEKEPEPSKEELDKLFQEL